MKKYKFEKATSLKNKIQYEKDENELTENEKKLLLGELIQAWNNCPGEKQIYFLENIINQLK